MAYSISTSNVTISHFGATDVTDGDGSTKYNIFFDASLVNFGPALMFEYRITGVDSNNDGILDGTTNTFGIAVGTATSHGHTGTVDIASFTSDSESGFAAMLHTFSGSITSGGGHTHTMTGSTALEGSGTAFSNLVPYIVVNYIIKL